MMIPIPLEREPEIILTKRTIFTNHEKVREYLDCPSWKCPVCNLTNFGRNQFCADSTCHTNAPEKS